MKERGIIFNAEMVQVILSGQKTQTRRLVPEWQQPRKRQEDHEHPDMQWMAVANRDRRWGFGVFGATQEKCADQLERYGLCPFGSVGDRLWVRETSGIAVRRDAMGGSGEFRVYRASDPGAVYCTTADGGSIPIKWIPSIHMPRKASRILLEITGVRVEKLQSISSDDCRKEGCPGGHGSIPGYGYNAAPREHYAHLWESIYGEDSWRSNPWVWVIDFKRVEGGAA